MSRARVASAQWLELPLVVDKIVWYSTCSQSHHHLSEIVGCFVDEGLYLEHEIMMTHDSW